MVSASTDVVRVRVNIDNVDVQRPARGNNRANAGLMLGQRRRRWGNINPAVARHVLFGIG